MATAASGEPQPQTIQKRCAAGRRQPRTSTAERRSIAEEEMPLQVTGASPNRNEEIVVNAHLLPLRIPTARSARQWVRGVSVVAHLLEDAGGDQRSARNECAGCRHRDDSERSADDAPEIAAPALATERQPTVPERCLDDCLVEIVAENVIVLVHRSRLDLGYMRPRGVRSVRVVRKRYRIVLPSRTPFAQYVPVAPAGNTSNVAPPA